VSRSAFDFRGALEADALRVAWATVVDRHPALRASFRWSGGGEPVQVIHRSSPLDWREVDVRDTGEMPEEPVEPFDLSRPPIMRFRLVRHGDEAWRLIWHRHHALLDGWSQRLVLREVFEIYERAVLGVPAERRPRASLAPYFDWLSKRDHAGAEAFWRAEHRIWAPPSAAEPLRAARTTTGTTKSIQMRRSRLGTDAETKALARAGLSRDTAAHAAWAVTLSVLQDTSSPAYGYVSSGRSAEVRGIDEMIGMFITSVPFWHRLEEEGIVFDWAMGVQARLRRYRDHEWIGLERLARIGASRPGASAFDSVLIFSRFPEDESGFAAMSRVTLEKVQMEVDNGVPVTIRVTAGPETLFEILYDSGQVAAAIAARTLALFERAHGTFLESSSGTIGAWRQALSRWDAAAEAARTAEVGTQGLARLRRRREQGGTQ
jgi:hypothetical protein